MRFPDVIAWLVHRPARRVPANPEHKEILERADALLDNPRIRDLRASFLRANRRLGHK